MRPFAVFLCVSLIAAPVLAHNGVKDPQVMARMELMKSIGANTKILGQMAKEEVAFDAGRAGAAAAEIAKLSAGIAASFEAPATDPKSEAAPAIWTDFATFLEQADALTLAAQKAQTGSLAEVRASLSAIGATCKDCHKGFRID